MSGIVVHGIPGSPYVRSALLGLEEKRIPYRLAIMPMGAARTSGVPAAGNPSGASRPWTMAISVCTRRRRS